MSNIRRIALSTCIAITVAAVSALPAAAGSIVVERAWAETEENNTADIFAIIKNTGVVRDVLYAVKTKVARQVKLEALSEAEDRAGRNQTVLKFYIEPGQTLELTEDGPHIELKRMRRALRDGETFNVTFFFERAGPIFADVTVEDD